MATIIKRSPTRIDFSGGTLDCWPLYLMVDSAITINLCIDILTQADLKVLDTPEIKIDISDLSYKKTFKNLNDFLNSKDSELTLIKAHIAHWRPTYGFELRTSSQSPVGGGLGGSSSLSMGLIEVFSHASKVDLSSEKKVILAGNLEAQVLGKPTGTQDYFPSYLHGLNAIHYSPWGFKTENLPVNLDQLGQCLSLIYTGRPHHSGINNWAVIKAVFDGDSHVLSALKEIKSISSEMYGVLKSGDLSELSKLFNRELESRLKLAKEFSSPEIMKLRDVALKAGAQAVKICGAGGGGCVALWSPAERKKEVESVCAKEGFQVLPMKPVTKPFELEVRG